MLNTELITASPRKVQTFYVKSCFIMFLTTVALVLNMSIAGAIIKTGLFSIPFHVSVGDIGFNGTSPLNVTIHVKS
jgi:hypothetical protein